MVVPESQVCSFPKRHKISRSMRKFLKKQLYEVTFDTCFRHVIAMCAKLREGNTWITPEIIESYSKLHDLGFAHSVETWYEGRLVGGLYGVSLGNVSLASPCFRLWTTLQNSPYHSMSETRGKRFSFDRLPSLFKTP